MDTRFGSAGHGLRANRFCAFALGLATTLIAGCATDGQGNSPRATSTIASTTSFPLETCKTSASRNCRAALFSTPAGIAKRDAADFPARYLELYDPKVRADFCAHASTETASVCATRLEALNFYFNPTGDAPAADEVGLALEGGGTKSAAFSLGALAGAQKLGLFDQRNPESTDAHITAIASVSGGTYAASYYFNRWFDRIESEHGKAEQERTGSTADVAGPVAVGTDMKRLNDPWFASCIPSYFSVKYDAFDPTITGSVDAVSCHEKTIDPATGKIVDAKGGFETAPNMGYVWRNHDLFSADTQGNLDTDEEIFAQENSGILFATLGGLGEGALLSPVEQVSRGIFRWPVNTSPLKLDYKLGLEREYGYTAESWAAAGTTAFDHLKATLCERHKTRTLGALGDGVEWEKSRGVNVPRWILGSTAPGGIGPFSWISPSPRDPLREQFELTWTGYGSGTYGYAMMPPESYFELCGGDPASMPIIDAVIASAAFFDDDQEEISQQPTRFFANVGQQSFNLGFYTEIRNYNTGASTRAFAEALPWPFYTFMTDRESETPYIHLQDGGNTENSGIFPLLRRGYKTIIFAHGTLDNQAQWTSICHLKNQLELDGTYGIDSDSLNAFMNTLPVSPIIIYGPGEEKDDHGHKFSTFLDGLCSMQLDNSDLVAFNELRPFGSAVTPAGPVSQLYCRRLGYVQAAGDAPCPEFKRRFDDGVAEFVEHDTKKEMQNAFYHWPAKETVTFQVHRAGDETCPKTNTCLSTIIALPPAISFADVERQTSDKGYAEGKTGGWKDWCTSEEKNKDQAKIAACFAPDGKLISDGAAPAVSTTGLPCIALAHIVKGECHNDEGSHFPQNDFALMTWHTTYTSYAAYFDLARQEMQNALCYNLNGSFPKPRGCLE